VLLFGNGLHNSRKGKNSAIEVIEAQNAGESDVEKEGRKRKQDSNNDDNFSP